jgi:hypothetical protein
MKTADYIILGILIVACAAIASYAYGKSEGKNEKNNELQSELITAQESEKSAWSINQELSDTNEKLVDDYNNLRDAVIKYVDTTHYAPRQTLTCNSYSYGMSSVATTCY